MFIQLFPPQTMPKQTDILLKTFADSAICFSLWQLKIQGLNEEKQNLYNDINNSCDTNAVKAIYLGRAETYSDEIGL